MPRSPRVPSYKLHKPSGQARTIVDGQHVYLGLFGSPHSREKYARIVAERWGTGGSTANGLDAAASAQGQRYAALSINELLLRYLIYAESYYVQDGHPTGEVENMKDAMRALRTLYEHSRADEFGPRALKLVREHMISVERLSRGVINARIDRIKRIFRWAVSEELLPPSIYDGLRTVAGLRHGRSNARETEPVGPVPDVWVEATLKFLPPQLADMVRLQRITGMRSGNLVLMRPAEIDRSSPVWVFEPTHHKTQHHKKRLRILIGPQGQAIVEKFLDREPQDYLFSPVEVEAWRAEQRRLKAPARKTPIFPSESQRVEREKQASRRRKRRRAPGAHFTPYSYRRAIRYAIGKANKAGVAIPMWFPHQLRHSKATEVRRQFGVEGAQLALGHAKANITEVYAERDLEFATRIARKTG